MDKEYCPRCQCLVQVAVSDKIVDDMVYVQTQCLLCHLIFKSLFVDKKAWEALH